MDVEKRGPRKSEESHAGDNTDTTLPVPLLAAPREEWTRPHGRASRQPTAADVEVRDMREAGALLCLCCACAVGVWTWAVDASRMNREYQPEMT